MDGFPHSSLHHSITPSLQSTSSMKSAIRNPRSAIPTILVAPSTEREGAEFADWSLSLSNRYTDALMAAGGLPLVMPATARREAIAQAVRRCQGVLLTGGDDIDPKLYAPDLPEALAKTTGRHDAERDVWEKLLIEQVFQQRKPLLAICRGQQMLNVALGGTLLADILAQRPRAINHRRMDQRSKIVHQVQLTPGSLLAKIAGGQRLGVNSTHHQAVARVAAPLRVAAVSSDGIVESLELRPGAARMLPFLLSVQFHPERLVDRYPEHRAIFRMFTQACVLNRKDNI